MGEFGPFGREPTRWSRKSMGYGLVTGVYGLSQVWIKTESTVYTPIHRKAMSLKVMVLWIELRSFVHTTLFLSLNQYLHTSSTSQLSLSSLNLLTTIVKARRFVTRSDHEPNGEGEGEYKLQVNFPWSSVAVQDNALKVAIRAPVMAWVHYLAQTSLFDSGLLPRHHFPSLIL